LPEFGLVITFPGLGLGVGAGVVGVEGLGLELFSSIGAGVRIGCAETDVL